MRTAVIARAVLDSSVAPQQNSRAQRLSGSSQLAVRPPGSKQTMNEATTTATRPGANPMVKCGNCGADNIIGATLCNDCDAHLYIVCRHCGRSNNRVVRNCAGCSGRLGGSRWKRRFRRIFRRVDPLTVIVGVVVLLVLFLLLVNHQRSSIPVQTDRPNVAE